MNTRAIETLMSCAPWQRAFTIQQSTVRQFHQLCAESLGERCPLLPLKDKQLTVQRNLFSTLFIMAIEAAGVPAQQLPLYALVNQCLRIQVTGCDNILDDEYKSVIPFALTGSGTRFRSVLTIMSADSVLARIVLDEVASGRMELSEGKKLLTSALSVLIPSGIEEHEEESLNKETIPTVDVILTHVHPRKTGLLFEAPVRLVEMMNAADPQRAPQVAKALGDFGVGCQILDDLKDVADDLANQKYNVIISHAFHGDHTAEHQLISTIQHHTITHAEAETIAAQLSQAKGQCLTRAIDYFLRAEQTFSRCFPDFGAEQAAALGALVHSAISSERNDS